MALRFIVVDKITNVSFAPELVPKCPAHRYPRQTLGAGDTLAFPLPVPDQTHPNLGYVNCGCHSMKQTRGETGGRI